MLSVPSTPNVRIRDRLRGGLARRIAIDRRGLAAFRIALGCIILTDLALRSRDLVAFYTDAGVLSRSALFSNYETIYSLHAISGAAWAQWLLFALAGIFAIALLVGYRTRLATVVSWLLLVSLHLRNPMILNAGDTLLRMLLFWGMFLPLGEHWAVDARKGDDEAQDATTTTVASIATVALLLQVVLVYSTNALHKLESDEWMGGEAVSFILQADHYTILLGDVLAGHTALLEVFTYAWVALLFASPLLIAFTGILRAILTSAFVGMHAGMALTLAIDVFPLVSIVALIPFYPPVFWSKLAWLAERLDLDAIARSLAAVARARVDSLGFGNASAGASEGDDGADAEADHPMVSALGVGALTDRGGASALADGLAPVRSLAATVAPCVFLVLVVASCVASVGYVTMPDAGDDVLDSIHGTQNWDMFAPHPTRTTRWVAAPGTLSDGTEVDVFHQSRVDLDRPVRAESTFPNARWRKYLGHVWFADNERHRPYFANYICDRWNRQSDSTVESVSVVGLWERTHPYDGTVDSGDAVLIEYDCPSRQVPS